ncbi:Retrovirus-related Pol polyprotein from transposon TNT 1-94 [Araneus ventricosus]|uniref:Retrovirus-related Pol polyprotein from transposon TNT 1-94 n=1 Tax=Araneus ventricosus TaxID=182803 RepID=A0A4Y2L0V6_ARAVE|nr:Retrovirus-related Pol polyprotein from transposon TNT 1-94 [Araneus ventricosus]
MRMIHSDLCGPVEPATLSGERYFLTFVDDYSRFCEVRLIKKKSDVAVEFKKFLKLNETVKRIRCDNAKEYVPGELQKVARNAGVEIDPCPPYTPQLNGVAERMNRTLFDKACAMLYTIPNYQKVVGDMQSKLLLTCTTEFHALVSTIILLMN